MAELAEQIAEDREPEEGRAYRAVSEAMADALVREAVGLVVLAVVLLVMDERFRIWARGQLASLWKLGRRDKSAEEKAVAVFRRQLSDYEHQAASGDGGCGCV
jgi:hypothetical protein